MNAVIYARYSSNAQSEQSIEGQLSDCYKYAEQEGLAVVGEYIDRAMTGKNDDRPEFQRMLKDARKRQFERVLVWRFDRFARNRYDSAINKHELKKYGVKVVSVMERIPDSPEGILLEAMLEASAEYYSSELSTKIKRGMAENAKKGLYAGGGVPYGLKIVDGHYTVDEEAAPIVRSLFERYADGASKAELAAWLNERGIRIGRSGIAASSVFNVMLHNRRYIGEFMQGGVKVATDCPAIMDEALFERVQARVASNKRCSGANQPKEKYLLQGKAYCGMCGARLDGESGRGKGGNVYRYYKCHAAKRNPNACKKRPERKGFLEWYVVEQTVKFVLEPRRINRIADAMLEVYEQEFSKKGLGMLQAKADRLEKEINLALDMSLKAPNMEGSMRFMNRMTELEAQKNDVLIDISKLRIASTIHFTHDEIVAWLKLFCDGDPLDENFREKIIDVLINSVYLYDNRVIIYYNIKGGKQVSYIEMAESLEDTVPLDTDGTSDCSNGVSLLPPKSSPFEPRIVFAHGLFGLLLWRCEDDR